MNEQWLSEVSAAWKTQCSLHKQWDAGNSDKLNGFTLGYLAAKKLNLESMGIKDDVIRDYQKVIDELKEQNAGLKDAWFQVIELERQNNSMRFALEEMGKVIASVLKHINIKDLT